MEREIIMCWVNAERCGLKDKIVTDAQGYVGCIDARPKDEGPYIKNGDFDIEAYENDAITILFAPNRSVYIGAFRWLRSVRSKGHINKERAIYLMDGTQQIRKRKMR